MGPATPTAEGRRGHYVRPPMEVGDYGTACTVRRSVVNPTPFSGHCSASGTKVGDSPAS